MTPLRELYHLTGIWEYLKTHILSADVQTLALWHSPLQSGKNSSPLSMTVSFKVSPGMLGEVGEGAFLLILLSGGRFFCNLRNLHRSATREIFEASGGHSPLPPCLHECPYSALGPLSLLGSLIGPMAYSSGPKIEVGPSFEIVKVNIDKYR